jgi:oligo-1,6-glucosidase
MTAWWRASVVYQIYPRSFMDSNGDGIGDLRGIIGKLDYLARLGIDIVWLSPIYASPNDDNGYDISDYRDINPEFGTLADFDDLAAGLHARGMKLVMDLVVNHTSDEHAWFRSARASRDSPYRDWYIWRDGKEGAEPNNWASFFGGSAWQYNAATGDYYLHLFSARQPDLNWENPAVRREVYDMMHWWIARGVDGFRMDVINALSKVQDFPDAPNPDGQRYVFAPQYFMNGPRIHEFYAEMKREVIDKYDLFTVGEAALTTVEEALAMVDPASGAMNMVIMFEHTDLDMVRHSFATKWHRKPFDLDGLKRIMTRWQTGMAGRGWNCLYLNNHDQPRAVSRFADPEAFPYESATMLATFLHLLQGTPFVYQGEELGMTNVAFPTIEDYRDIESINGFAELVRNQGFAPAEALAKVQFRSRDNARTPMQWTAGPNAGFTTGTPWLKLNPNHTRINAASQIDDPNSVFHYYARLIRLRRTMPVIVDGSYALIETGAPSVYAYTRDNATDRLLVLANFAGSEATCAVPEGIDLVHSRVLIGNHPAAISSDPARLVLRPYEAQVYHLSR